MMYGALFMMAGAYALARDSHVRGDVRLPFVEAPETQATVELVLVFPALLSRNPRLHHRRGGLCRRVLVL